MAKVAWDAPMLVEIERIIRRGGTYLSEALLDYWPNHAGREVPERNATVHVARSFAERGYHVYEEVPASKNDWIDLVAIDPCRGIQVAVEAKRLGGVQALGGILQDVDKIEHFHADPKELRQPVRERYGVVIATTWSDDYAAWWASTDADPPSEHETWTRLDDDPRLQGKKAIFGSCVLRSFEDWRAHDENFHYLLYGVFVVPG